MTKYEESTAIVKEFFRTHTPAEAVAKIKKIAPYAFKKAALKKAELKKAPKRRGPGRKTKSAR